MNVNNLSPEERYILKVKIENELIVRARTDFKVFAKLVNPEYTCMWFHELIAEDIENIVSGELKRQMTFMPPRHGKTFNFSELLPAYKLGRDPDAKIIHATYSPKVAETYALSVRKIMESDIYKKIFPDTKLPTNQRIHRNYANKVMWFQLVDKKGGYQAVGSGQAINGTGAHLIILDDPIKDRKAANNANYREEVWQWWLNSLSRRVENSQVAIVMATTRWHEDDLAGRLIASDEKMPWELRSNWKTLKFSGIAVEPLEPYDTRNVGEALWEEKISIKKHEADRIDMGSFNFEALIQQNPIPQDGGIFKKEWWVYWTVLPRNTTAWTISIDAAYKGDATSDFVVLQVWCTDKENKANHYLVAQIRRRMNFNETVQAVRMLIKQYPRAQKKLIENKANGAAIINTLRGSIPGIIEVNPMGSKDSRMQAVTPYIESGNVYLPQNAPWLSDFMEEVSQAPFGKNDDQVDAMSQYLNYVYGDTNRSRKMITWR